MGGKPRTSTSFRSCQPHQFLGLRTENWSTHQSCLHFLFNGCIDCCILFCIYRNRGRLKNFVYYLYVRIRNPIITKSRSHTVLDIDEMWTVNFASNTNGCGKVQSNFNFHIGMAKVVSITG